MEQLTSSLEFSSGVFICTDLLYYDIIGIVSVVLFFLVLSGLDCLFLILKKCFKMNVINYLRSIHYYNTLITSYINTFTPKNPLSYCALFLYQNYHIRKVVVHRESLSKRMYIPIFLKLNY